MTNNEKNNIYSLMSSVEAELKSNHPVEAYLKIIELRSLVSPILDQIKVEEDK